MSLSRTTRRLLLSSVFAFVLSIPAFTQHDHHDHGKDTVKKEVKAFLEQTGVDELIAVSAMYDIKDRLKSARLFAEIMITGIFFVVSRFFKNLQMSLPSCPDIQISSNNKSGYIFSII